MQERDLFVIDSDEIADNTENISADENEKELIEYERNAEDEADICYLESMKGISDFSVSEFVSRSNGNGRKPRKRPRDILIIKYRDTTFYAENGGDIKPKKSGRIGLDVLAMETLQNTGIEPTVDNLIETIRYYDEIKQRVRRYNKP